MKKLLLLYISIIGFILPMWADFDPTKDTPPAVLPENIHPVQGKEKNDKGVLGPPTFIPNNTGVKYEWYKFSTITKKYEYAVTCKGVTNDKYKPLSEGKYMCVVDASPLPITELFEYNTNPQPVLPPEPEIKLEELTPCNGDTVILSAETVADKLEWVMIKDNREESLPEAFNKNTLEVYCPQIVEGETLFLRNKVIYYTGMTLSKNLIENGDFEDASSDNNHYNGFSSSYDFYELDGYFTPKQLITDENGNIVQDKFPGYYRLCTKGLNLREPDLTKGGKYFLELDGDSNPGGVAYSAKLRTPLEKGQKYQFSYMAVTTCTTNNGPGIILQEYGRVVFKLKYKDSNGIEHTEELLEEKEINHHDWRTYGEGIYWTAPTDCYDAEIVLTNSASSFGANDFGLDNIMFQRYYPIEKVIYEDFKISPKECVEEVVENVEITVTQVPYVWTNGNGESYSESGRYEYSYKEKRSNNSWYLITKILNLTIIPEQTPDIDPVPDPMPDPIPDPNPLPNPEPEPLPEAVPLDPMEYFTPNGDGVADKWLVEGLEFYPDATVEIYDRFQRKLITERSVEFTGWDGNYNGHPMPNDDYWYLIITPGQKATICGHFTLKR